MPESRTPESRTPESQTRGLFISFEGVEGCGKTTQAELLAANLTAAGYSVCSTKEPGGTKLGEKIRELVLASAGPAISAEAELFLFLADRAQHVAEVIKPALKMGQVVISDRYLDATAAYQGYGRGFSLEFIEQMSCLATAGVLPQITILLDLEPGLGLQRTRRRGGDFSPDRMEQQDLDFHSRVRQGYLELAALYPERIHRIEATCSPQAISQVIWQLVQSHGLPSHGLPSRGLLSRGLPSRRLPSRRL